MTGNLFFYEQSFPHNETKVHRHQFPCFPSLDETLMTLFTWSVLTQAFNFIPIDNKTGFKQSIDLCEVIYL